MGGKCREIHSVQQTDDAERQTDDTERQTDVMDSSINVNTVPNEDNCDEVSRNGYDGHRGDSASYLVRVNQDTRPKKDAGTVDGVDINDK